MAANTHCSVFAEDDESLAEIHALQQKVQITDGLTDTGRTIVRYLLTKNTFQSVSEVAIAVTSTDLSRKIPVVQGSLCKMAQVPLVTPLVPLLDTFGHVFTRCTNILNTDMFCKLSEIARALFQPQETYQEYLPQLKCPSIPLAVCTVDCSSFENKPPTFLSVKASTLINYFRKRIAGETVAKLQPELPYYRGNLIKIGASTLSVGMAMISSTRTVTITELPLGHSGEDYETRLLLELQESGEIESFAPIGDTGTVAYVVAVSPEKLEELRKNGDFFATFKLVTKDPQKLRLLNSSGNEQLYQNVNHVVEEFYDWRLAEYDAQKERHLKVLEAELECLTVQTSVLTLEEAGIRSLDRTSTQAMETQLRAEYSTFSEEARQSVLNLTIWQSTHQLTEYLEVLIAKRKDIKKSIWNVKQTDAKAMWLADLTSLEPLVLQLEARRLAEFSDSTKLLYEDEARTIRKLASEARIIPLDERVLPDVDLLVQKLTDLGAEAGESEPSSDEGKSP